MSVQQLLTVGWISSLQHYVQSIPIQLAEQIQFESHGSNITVEELVIVPTTAKRAGVPRPLSRQLRQSVCCNIPKPQSRFDGESAAGKPERVRVERPNKECRQLKGRELIHCEQ